MTRTGTRLDLKRSAAIVSLLRVRALRRARAELAAASMQRASLAAGTDRLTLEEINAEIDAVREAREGSGHRTMNLYRETETPDDT